MSLPISKLVMAMNNLAITGAATGTANIDTLGFDYAMIDVIATTSDNVTNNPTVFRIGESDDTVVTNFANITALVGDGVGGWVIPNMVTVGDWGVKFMIDLRPRKRYLRLTISPLTNHIWTTAVNLFRGEEAPINSTKAGVNAIVCV